MNNAETHRDIIKAKVAALITDSDIAINAGTNAGVVEGMKFSIRADTAIEIIDPDTAEILDIIDDEIIRVIAVEVKDRYSLCRTYRIREVGNQIATGFQTELSRAITGYLSGIPNHVVRESITNPLNKVQQRVDESKSIVKVGYRAIEIQNI